jgi:hypothetical protein
MGHKALKWGIGSTTAVAGLGLTMLFVGPANATFNNYVAPTAGEDNCGIVNDTLPVVPADTNKYDYVTIDEREAGVGDVVVKLYEKKQGPDKFLTEWKFSYTDDPCVPDPVYNPAGTVTGGCEVIDGVNYPVAILNNIGDVALDELFGGTNLGPLAPGEGDELSLTGVTLVQLTYGDEVIASATLDPAEVCTTTDPDPTPTPEPTPVKEKTGKPQGD